jgi:hypothetical protein
MSFPRVITKTGIQQSGSSQLITIDDFQAAKTIPQAGRIHWLRARLTDGDAPAAWELRVGFYEDYGGGDYRPVAQNGLSLSVLADYVANQWVWVAMDTAVYTDGTKLLLQLAPDGAMFDTTQSVDLEICIEG